jgi:serine/threonine protein kinase
MSLRQPVTFETAFILYKGTDIIGEGGAGHVYQATDESGDVYAIKVLEPTKANSDKLKRFKNEVEFCRRNQHRNIIKIIGDGRFIDGKKHSPFYVMPLYTCSLRTLLEIGIPPEKILFYFSQLLDGVEAAHLQGVTHRDLKPENVLYDKTEDLLVIADFGIAHFEEEAIYTAVETSPNARLANFQYAAPEQRARGAKIDCPADIYALGLMLNEMFTGMVPYGTRYKTISSVVLDYGYLDEIVSEMLDQSVSARTNSIEKVKNQLIGRKLEFVTRQRLSELKQAVVPVTDLDDPLIINPPRLIDFDYQGRLLILYLSRPVNDKWVYALHNMRNSYSSLMGKGPEEFHFSGDTATIQAADHDAQQIIDYFKTWLPIANGVYEKTIRRENQEEEDRQRQELQRKIEEEERSQRLRASLRI